MPGRTRVADATWGLFVLSVIAGLGVYVGVRAWALSFTHDESLTYTSYVHRPFSSILLSRETDANNHPLNTLAMKLGGGLFGPSEIALRWSSVVAFVVYLLALLVLLRRVERRPIRILGISIAIASPYVLDFFSLARGYGLAWPWSWSVRCSHSALRSIRRSPRHWPRSRARRSPSLPTSQHSTTTSRSSSSLCSAGRPVRAAARSIAIGPLIAAVMLPTVGVALLAGIPLRRLRSEGELYFGGHTGFWQDTVRSLISSTL